MVGGTGSGFFAARLGTRAGLSQRPSHRFPSSLRDVHQRTMSNGHPILAGRFRTRARVAVLLAAARIERRRARASSGDDLHYR